MLVAKWMVAKWLVAKWLVADWLVADWLLDDAYQMRCVNQKIVCLNVSVGKK